ncbi:hypothetical protein [Aeromonas media]|uniref:Uncharacterized protein n=1 Tax=Aeromonas media TaxID=651 RepID=A0AAW5RE73_AERME|nr:hypothetical protein [Aeromonas media]MBS4639826.1 hypothetical protein [Aeromonas media]MCV3287025.1 hypothetical protein [Aeromonas media]
MAVSDYLKGSGTVWDPYVIHNLAAAIQFFSVDIFRSGVFAELVVDLDLSANTFNQNTKTVATLNGNGYTLTGLKHFTNNNQAATFKKLNLVSINWLNTFGQQGSEYINFEDVVFRGGTLACYSGRMNFTRCTMSSIGWKYMTAYQWGVVDSVALPPTSYALPSGFTDLRSVADPFSASRYPNYASSVWAIDGASAPRLLRQNIANLVQGYLVKGVVKVGGVLKPRFVRALSVVDFVRINDAVAEADGSFSLKCGHYSDAVMVATYEPYGTLLVASKAYVLGDIIHPATPNGFRYLCTKAGNSGTSLPPEPWSTTDTLTVGAAIFTPDPIYQPQLHGPIKPVLCDLITGLPV